MSIIKTWLTGGDYSGSSKLSKSIKDTRLLLCDMKPQRDTIIGIVLSDV